MEFEIELSHILWHTRGKSWDYMFLLEPTVVQHVDWYSVFREVFEIMQEDASQSESAELSEHNWIGEFVREGGGAVPFFAAYYSNESVVDMHKRPIAHYFLWLHPTKDVDSLRAECPRKWDLFVLEALSSAYERVLNIDCIATGGGELKTAAADIRRALNLECEMAFRFQADALPVDEMTVLSRPIFLESQVLPLVKNAHEKSDLKRELLRSVEHVLREMKIRSPLLQLKMASSVQSFFELGEGNATKFRRRLAEVIGASSEDCIIDSLYQTLYDPLIVYNSPNINPANPQDMCAGFRSVAMSLPTNASRNDIVEKLKEAGFAASPEDRFVENIHAYVSSDDDRL